MKLSSASPLTPEQYCQTPVCSPLGSPSAPIDQWLKATCWPSGKASPSSEVHGAAMNLERWLSEPAN
jgi:hypothetical protein